MTFSSRHFIVLTSSWIVFSHAASAMSFITCKEVMQIADFKNFNGLADVAMFAHDHQERLALPELLAVANYAANFVEPQPSRKETLNYKSTMDGVVIARQQANLDSDIDVKQIAADTVMVLKISEEDQWDQHAAYMAAEYIEFWADLFQKWPQKYEVEKNELIKNIKPSIASLEKLLIGAPQQRTRKSVEIILKTYHVHMLEESSKEFWRGSKDFPEVALKPASSTSMNNVLAQIHLVFEKFEERYLSGKTKTAGRPNISHFVEPITSALARASFWHFLITERPSDANILLKKLDEMQRFVILYGEDDVSSQMKVSLLLQALHVQLRTTFEAINDNTRFSMQVNDIINNFPRGALSPTMKKEQICEAIRSGYSHQGHNVILHGPLQYKIKDALNRVERSKDKVEVERSAWFLFHVLQELYAKSSVSH